ncbi:MAG: hydantoinase/oxoprolinase family protein, partial [Pseudomonadota bacterium]
HLLEQGLSCPVLMMTSGGGMTALETASRYPIRLVESGPAGGAILASRIAVDANLNAAVSFDMGGTTAKLCLIDDGRPQTSRRFEVSRAARFIKGSGMPVRIPVVEMIEIGAGGGSIAAVDHLGRLGVGPQSAGSEPGPAAFARGGTRATVTDADVVLGFIDPERFAEGRIGIDIEAAECAVRHDVGEKLGLKSAHAARGISEIVDENMASAGRMHAAESGKDLGDRTMIAFGGNGPLHATRVARCIGVDRIIIPNNPSVGSAVGFLFAPVSYEIVRSLYSRLDDLDLQRVNTLFDTLVAEAEEVVNAGAPGALTEQQRTAFMRYHGQGHEIEVRLPARRLEGSDLPALRAAFEEEYRRQFSRVVPGMDIEILNWSTRVSTAASVPAIEVEDAKIEHAEPAMTRTITCDVSGAQIEARVFDRAELKPGDSFAGPALVIEPQTSTLVSSDFSARVDSAGHVILERM